MSRLSDELINSLMQLVESYAHYMKMAEQHGDRFGDSSGATTYWYKIREEVQAIEREAYKQGQEDMLERVFQINDCEAIRNLEIEEPK